MLDKISKLYVTHISSFGAKICTDSGKKTLNLEHILEALKQMQFNKHIERLVKDLKNSEIDSSKYDQLEEDKKNENKNLKQLINKKKKRGGRKKKCFEDENERDQMKKMQEKMFEEARNDMNKQQEKTMLENIGYKINDENNDEEDYKDNFDLNEDKEKKDEKGKDKEKYDDSDQNCCINNGEDDDINFD